MREGQRVKLIKCTDPFTPRQAGLTGTVTQVDGIGTIHVAWDNGTNLGLVPGHDEWEEINDG